jgi:hypothetical protein
VGQRRRRGARRPCSPVAGGEGARGTGRMDKEGALMRREMGF